MPPGCRAPAGAPKKSINEKALLAVEWLDRAVFMPDPLVATLFRFFALEALLGKASERLETDSCPPADDAQPRSRTSTSSHPDDMFLQYDQVLPYAVHGEIAPAVSGTAGGRVRVDRP